MYDIIYSEPEHKSGLMTAFIIVPAYDRAFVRIYFIGVRLCIK